MPRNPFALNKAIQRRRSQRDALWPDAGEVVFNSAAGGWCQMPRTVPMIAALIDMLGGKDKPGRLYIALWTYEYSDGFVEIPDPARIALEAGYVTRRAERTFNERMYQLRELGFIRATPLGNREFGFVLLLDPHRTVLALRANKPSSVPRNWWTAFVARCGSVGISLEPSVTAEVVP
jgi:hypothetical protein